MKTIKFDPIKVYPSNELDTNTMMFELFQRIAYEYWLAIEEGMWEALKKDQEKMLFEVKKQGNRTALRKKQKEFEEGNKRYLARTKAYAKKVEDMQKIFEKGGIRNDNMENAVDKMYELIDQVFEQKL